MSLRFPPHLAATAFLVTGCIAWAKPLPPELADTIRQGYQSSDRDILAQTASLIEAQLRTDPENTELRGTLATLYLDRLKEPAKALPHLEKVAAESPGDSEWQQALARAYRETGKNDRAVEHFRKAGELKPGDAWPRFQLGNMLATSGQYREAATAYREALQVDPKNTELRFALAKTLWAAGDKAAAEEMARSVLEYDPGNNAARKLLAAVGRPQDEHPDPVTSAPEARPSGKAASSSVDAAITEAYATGRRDRFARAADALEGALHKAPGNLNRRKSLAFIYLEKLHAPAKALPHLERIVAAIPDDSGWLQMLARAQEATGDRAAAAVSYRRAIKLTPRDVWIHYHLGCTLRDLKKDSEAEAAFREALKLDPKNKYVRRELARCATRAGRTREAANLAHELIHEDAADAEAHAILGDVYRKSHDFAAAGTEYQAALAGDPAQAIAIAGIREIQKEQRSQAKLAFYTFDDTDDLRQTGVFSHVSFFLNPRLQASAFFNERWFKRPPGETAERLEGGVGLTYRFSGAIQLAGGVSQFKTENRDRETGANIALYVAPASFVDAWVSYRYAEPVNDSYTTARKAFTQDILSAGINLRPYRNIAASFTASTADYSDGNTRRSALASLAWWVPVKTSPVVRLEYEWLDYDEHTPDYSSPDSYGRLRPVLEFTPKITDWLVLELHGELDYVFDESEWGYGFTAGPRFYAGDWLDVGLMYMKYEIPGGQTTWSGEGFKVDLTYRF